MKILVIGSGGREHALVWRLRQDPAVTEVIATPGNPGIAQVARIVSGSSVTEIATAERPDLVVVGPEAPLMEGVADQLRAQGIPVVGPSAAAAQLEGSKAFSKDFMVRHGIPTARSVTVRDAGQAREAANQFGYPVVIKADGLAAGKGVHIVTDPATVEASIAELMKFGDGTLVIEEFLQGEEISYIVLSDGQTFTAYPPSQDHKRAYDNDEGPNTGGMGAYSHDGLVTPEQRAVIEQQVIQRAINGMAADGRPFVGFLYAGLMMTSQGPKVLEFNVRMGDPETQALLPRVQGPFAAVLLAAAQGSLAGQRFQLDPRPSCCVVMAADGYPTQVRTGDEIAGLDAAQQTGALVFHAGTKQTDAKLVTSGGRVLSTVALADTLPRAIAHAYQAIDVIRFNGAHFRRDIAAKGLRL